MNGSRKSLSIVMLLVLGTHMVSPAFASGSQPYNFVYDDRSVAGNGGIGGLTMVGAVVGAIAGMVMLPTWGAGLCIGAVMGCFLGYAIDDFLAVGGPQIAASVNRLTSGMQAPRMDMGMAPATYQMPTQSSSAAALDAQRRQVYQQLMYEMSKPAPNLQLVQQYQGYLSAIDRQFIR